MATIAHQVSCDLLFLTSPNNLPLDAATYTKETEVPMAKFQLSTCHQKKGWKPWQPVGKYLSSQVLILEGPLVPQHTVFAWQFPKSFTHPGETTCDQGACIE